MNFNLDNCTPTQFFEFCQKASTTLYHNKLHPIEVVRYSTAHNITNATLNKNCNIAYIIATNGLYPSIFVTIPNGHYYCSLPITELANRSEFFYGTSKNLTSKQLVKDCSWLKRYLQYLVPSKDTIVGWKYNSAADYIVGQQKEDYFNFGIHNFPTQWTLDVLRCHAKNLANIIRNNLDLEFWHKYEPLERNAPLEVPLF